MTKTPMTTPNEPAPSAPTEGAPMTEQRVETVRVQVAGVTCRRVVLETKAGAVVRRVWTPESPHSDLPSPYYLLDLAHSQADRIAAPEAENARLRDLLQRTEEYTKHEESCAHERTLTRRCDCGLAELRVEISPPNAAAPRREGATDE